MIHGVFIVQPSTSGPSGSEARRRDDEKRRRDDEKRRRQEETTRGGDDRGYADIYEYVR